MKITNFVTPPEHINFLAKNLFGNCGEIINGSIAYLEPNGGRTCSITYARARSFGSCIK